MLSGAVISSQKGEIRVLAITEQMDYYTGS